MTGEFARTLSDGQAGFPALLAAIEAYLESHDVPPGPSAQLMIAFDEIISNVLNHGGGGGPAPRVDVRLDLAGGSAKAEVADDGKPFDPLAAPPPDTSLSVEDRQIGGLGIHLVRELMDEVSYAHENGKNRLRFSKIYPLG
jgi:serine/threonine-protein kinase RsbW